MPKKTFNDVWSNILSNEGEEFHTITGKKFIYKINSNTLITNRTDYNIPKSDIKRAFYLRPIKRPSEISNIVRGSSYIWAILNDNRIY
jgi:hypothetical protein